MLGSRQSVSIGVFGATVRRSVWALAAAALPLVAAGGCKSWLDQSELARHEGARLVVPILSSIDPIDEADAQFEGAQNVRQEDLKAFSSDYVISRNDVVNVTVEDPLNLGVAQVRTVRISETGLMSLPQLPDPIKAAGLTERQLQQAVAGAYRAAGVIVNAQVNVQVIEARGRTFSISGAVARPGQYVILESDFRLLNALIQAGEVTIPVDTLYVIRKLAADKPSAANGETQPDTGPAGGGTPPRTRPAGTADDPLAPPIRPSINLPGETTGRAADGSARPVLAQDTGDRIGIIEGQPVRVGPSATQPTGAGVGAGAGVTAAPAGVTDDATAAGPATQPGDAGYEFGSALRPDEDQRVIRVPLSALRRGDLRYNIVIRPGDLIIVPAPESGYYYLGGHVAQGGVYAISGLNKVTLTRAIAAARMLDPLAVPQKTDIIRRVGDSDRQVYVRVDLAKVFEGKHPDIYLKPDDLVMVGTDFWPPFLAAVRGAFRFSYGLGFLYDRNFAPEQDQQ